ncbi:type I restriction enzyme endonuclease domain-containing protein [Nocardia asiatica]|uniref:type I restriction enzyme endonuclease domain-containing protein n=1 Tax=Nocardia asiatica TaxID=209252 RepID=UPI003EDFC231
MGSNESARLAMQDETMRAIAHELTAIVRAEAKTDWNAKETVRAKLRTRIKRLLLEHGYPPAKESSATDLIFSKRSRLQGMSSSSSPLAGRSRPMNSVVVVTVAVAGTGTRQEPQTWATGKRLVIAGVYPA